MKNYLFILLIMLSINACQKSSDRYTQNSPEIEIVKNTIKHYDYRHWDSLMMNYADTAKIFYNSRDKILLPNDLKSYFTRNDERFSTRAFEEENREYEMIVDDNGKKWVNFWGLWIGNLDANNKKILIPVHITYQFNKSKIVEEFGYWNTSELVLELQKLDKEALETLDEPSE